MACFSSVILRSQSGGKRFAVVVGALCCFAATGAAQQPAPDLSTMSVEDLLNVQVTTAGKVEQKVSRIPAAIYVITAEDIRRSGLTTVPEALRLAPGVEVAQINASAWAIAIHGFNSRYSNKLLVLIDGRTVYSSTFTQVFWAIHDLPIEEVERIEVIRGPGGSVWGANAADGVINIITRTARQSQGGVVSVIGGSHDNAIVDARYGGMIGSGGAYRVSAHYADRGAFRSLNGGSNFDRVDLERIDSRIDWTASPKNSYTWEGSLFNVNGGETLTLATLVPPATSIVNRPISYSGGTGLLRWEHTLKNGSKTALQGYYDHTDVQESVLQDVEHTIDLDFQHQIHFGARHEVVWGSGFRVVRQDTSGGFQFSFHPPTRIPKLFSTFAQDEITLRPDRLWLTVGSKLEHNDHTGFEVEPTIRLLWAIRPEHSFWLAVSRAVRSPATFERGGQFGLSVSPGTAGVPVLVELKGNSQFTSENLVAFEVGYRTQPSKWASLDLASFYNLYQNLSSVTQGSPFLELDPAPVHFTFPATLGNAFHGRSFGAEIALTYTPAPFWKISGSYSWLRTYYLQNPGDLVDTPTFSSGANPSHQTQLHSLLSLSHRIELDGSVYYVSSLPGQGLPGHSRLDLHFAWSSGKRLQLSAGFQNLLDPRHVEFNEPPTPTEPGKIPRSVYGKAVWRF